MTKYRVHLLGLVCLALAGLVWFDNHDLISSLWSAASPVSIKVAQPAIDDHPAAPQNSTEALHIPPPPLGNPLAGLDKTTFENWVEHPLFAPSRRRPPPEVPNAQAVAPKALPNYAFIGVVLNPRRTVAVLRSVTNGASLHVEVGDTVGGWKVDSVGQHEVTLVRENDPAQVIQFKQACAEASGTCP